MKYVSTACVGLQKMVLYPFVLNLLLAKITENTFFLKNENHGQY